jgi:hypothetical protein
MRGSTAVKASLPRKAFSAGDKPQAVDIVMGLFPALDSPTHLHERGDRHRDVRHCNFTNKESGDGKRLRTQNAEPTLAHVLNASLNLSWSGVRSAHRRHGAGAHIDCLREPRMLPSLSFG